MKKFTYFIIGCFFSSASGFAQNEVDALRYSNITYGGTARFSAMGGAFGALGAEVSNMSINPAGIAFYRKTEFTFTPTIFIRSTASDYNGSSSQDSKSNFNFGNIGLIGAYTHNNKSTEENQTGWINTNFGIGYNRINNFHNRINIVGNNSGSSYLDVLLNNANGTLPEDLDPFAEDLAFRLYLLDTVSGDPYSYFTPIPAGSELKQIKSIESRGSMGETFITFGGNYSNKLYLGATFGIDNIRYWEEYDFQESDARDTIFDFNQYTYSGSFSTRGVGFNFKFGMIYRINDWARIGGSIHTPTFFSLHDEYSNQMAVEYDNGNTIDPVSSPSGSFDYNLATPMRATGSIGFVIAKKGLISADYEFVDYSSANLSSSPNVFFDANNAIRNKYVSTGNLRLGGELRLDPFSLRAGYALYGNPYKANTGNSAPRSIYSAGFGIRENDYFIDFAYTFSVGAEKYYLYDPALVNPAELTSKTSGIMVTLGFRY